MSNFLISFLIAVSASTWIFAKFSNKTGGNVSTALTASAVSGVLIFAIVLIISNMVL